MILALKMKLALVNILQKFAIEPRTPLNLEFIEGILRSTKTRIPITFKRRQLDI